MKQTKFLSCFLSLIMIFSCIPINVVHAKRSESAELYSVQDPVKSIRTVYIHAQGKNPTVTPNLSTVYMGDTAEIYFSIDKPNKGDYDSSAADDTEKHLEPHYDLNGYTVKIYYDPAFFELASDPAAPIDYTVPDANIDHSGSGNDEVGREDEKEEVENLPQKPGYFPYKHGSASAVINGKTYYSAYATIFFSGSWLPQESEPKDEDGNTIPAWYNLAKLPLTPLKTGNTEVFIDVDGSDEYTLELFAKNTTDEYAQTFVFDTVNGGHHQIIIKDKLKPDPPYPTPEAGKYTEACQVILEAEAGCDIYYKYSDEDEFIKYTPGQKIPVEWSRGIDTFARRLSDSKDSNQVTYVYQIVPKAPLLYDDDDTSLKLPNVYNEYTSYNVLVSENDPFSAPADENEIFYTFSDARFDEKLSEGIADPYEGWATLPRATQSIEITKNVKLRLYTKNLITGEVSDISVYYLSIKPAPVTSSHESGEYTEKIDITLETETDGAEIYYTTDQTDPRTNGILYDPDIPLTIYKDTTLRAVACHDGQWGDVSSFYYIFGSYDDYGIDAFHPSGVYEGNVSVTLTPFNPENTVLYSTDGGKKWKEFTEALIIDTDTDILAKAKDPDGDEGSIYTFTYRIKPLPPVFAPESTQFTNSDNVTIYTPESTNTTTERYELFYTVDGTDPINSKTRKQANEVSDSVIITITEYTVVSAVVLKDGKSYSNVVRNSYDIVNKKPVRPVPTLTPGNYTHEIGNTDGFSTQFLPIPESTQIYYTISYDGTFREDPRPGDEDTLLYDGSPIDIKGHTIIKAVAVNVFGVKSDIGIFEYIITPESPIAAPSSSVSGDKLPIVPVRAVVGSTVKYEIGEGDEAFENEFEVTDEEFYIDINTGMAYLDPDLTQRLGNVNDGEISSPAVLQIHAQMDGIDSIPNTYVYSVSEKDNTLAPPFADKDTGIYEERVFFEGDEDTLLGVKLYSVNYGDTIQYKLDSADEWTDYTNGSYVKLTKDSVLLLRSERDGEYSAVASYVYNFVPMAPIITLPSGTYSTEFGLPVTTIRYHDDAPENKDYNIFYRLNEDKIDVRYMNSDIEINKTMSVKAYVLNEDTGKISSSAISYYIIEAGDVSTGMVYIANPYDVPRISAHVLDSGEYAKGIRLLTNTKGADIQYYYSYTTVDGKSATTNNYIFDSAAPIFVNNTMEDITIYAKLLDKDGNEIEDSHKTFYIDFIHLDIPQTSLELTDPGKIEYKKGTKYTLINDYPDDETILIYYTVDGSDPTDPSNLKRKLYNGEELKVPGDFTVKAVYFSTCDGQTNTCIKCREDDRENCFNGVYGKVGKYSYVTPSKASTISGGEVIDKTRKYTKDYFGFEHPTHISYINGYPDGSVRADGNITREEMAVILYRVKNMDYSEPFTTTGDIFPDVKNDRWSVTEIEFMANEKVIIGYPEGDFRPTNKLTRAEFAALICRFAKLPEPTKENVFSDLDKDHWAYGEILSLYSVGFLNGYEDGTMRADTYITRAEVMKVMNIILGRKPVESYVKSIVVNPFNDLSTDKWYYVDVLEATITHDYFLDKNGYEEKWENIK